MPTAVVTPGRWEMRSEATLGANPEFEGVVMT